MNKQPAEWAKKRRESLVSAAYNAAGVQLTDAKGHAKMVEKVFEAYIEAHEDAPEPEVDPLLIEAREIAANTAKSDGSYPGYARALETANLGDYTALDAAYAALNRGIEIGKTTVTTQPDDPTSFTHLVDADGREVPVEFVKSGTGAGLWRVLGEHRVARNRFHEQKWWFNSDGTCAGYEGTGAHLIRKGADA